MIVKGVQRHMQKNPWSDEELASALITIRDHVDAILGTEEQE